MLMQTLDKHCKSSRKGVAREIPQQSELIKIQREEMRI